MPIVFNCPTCAKQLQVSDAAAGRQSKCPYCKGPITVPQAQAVAVTARPPLAVAPSPAPMSQPAAYPAASPEKPAFMPQFVQRVDRTLKRFGPWGYVAAGVGALVVFLLLIVIVVRLFGPGSGIDQASRYFPAKTNLIVAVNVEDILRSGIYKDLKKEVPDFDKMEKEMTKKGEIGIQDVSQVFAGSNVDTMDREGLIAVFILKHRMDVTFLNSRKGAEAGGVTIYEAADHCSCQVNGSTILECSGPPSTLQSVLTNTKTAGLTAAMKTACKEADFSRSISLVVSFQDVSKQGALGQLGLDSAALDALESLVVNVNFGSSDITVQAAATCKSAEKAKDILKLAEGAVAGFKLTNKDAPKEVLDLLTALKFEQSGAKVQLSVKITKNQAVSLLKSGALK